MKTSTETYDPETMDRISERAGVNQMTLTDVWDLILPFLKKEYDTGDKMDHIVLCERIGELLDAEARANRLSQRFASLRDILGIR